MNEPIYSSKCKTKTSNSNAITAQTSNGRWRASAQYLKCKTNKSQFIKVRVETIKNKKLLDGEDRLLLAKELHKPARTHFRKRRILVKGIDDIWAADLIDVKKYSEENDGYLCLLNVIDTFSKFAWALPIKKKGGVTVFESICKNN